MNYDEKLVIQRLVEESEHILMALQEDGLDKGKYPHLSRALDDAIGQSKEPDAWKVTFTERELKLISNCKVYARNDPAGLPGHNLMIIIDKFCMLFGMNESP